MKRIGLIAFLCGCAVGTLVTTRVFEELRRTKALKNPVGTSSSRTNDLRLTIRALKTRLLVMEPLFVQVDVENRSRKDLELTNTEAGSVRISFCRSGDNQWRECPDTYTMMRLSARPGWLSERVPACLPTVAPGEKLSIVREIYRVWDEQKGGFQFTFKAPGKYLIRASHSTIAGRHPLMHHDQVMIEVAEPRGDDRRALEYLKSIGRDGLAISQPMAQVDGAQWYEGVVRFVDKFPESTYAQYAAYSLATSAPFPTREDRFRYWKILVNEGERPFPLRNYAASSLTAMYRDLEGPEAERNFRDWLRCQLPTGFLEGRWYSTYCGWLQPGELLFTFKQN